MSKKVNIPAVIGGQIVPHMSPRARTQMVDDAMQQLGGLDKIVEWAGKNDENFGDFLKLWARGQLKPVMVEHRSDNRMEDVLARLDAGEHAKVILSNAETDE